MDTTILVDQQTDELPENLLSDLGVDSRGWLRSHSLSLDNDEDEDNAGSTATDTPYPALFSSCAKLLILLKLNHDEQENEHEAKAEVEAEVNEGGGGGAVISDEDGCNVEAGMKVKEEVKKKDVLELPYVPNVGDLITSSLMQLMKMTPKSKEDGARSRRNRKKIDKRSRVNQKYSNSEDANKAENENNQNESWVEIGENIAKEFPDEFEEYHVGASERTMVTFNVLAIILSIVVPAMTHPKRRDFHIKMKKGPSIKKAGKKSKNDGIKVEGNIMEGDASASKYGKKSQAYLFFENVYSIVSEKQLRTLETEIEQIRSIASDLHAKVMGYQKDGFEHTERASIPKLFLQTTLSTEDLIQRTLLTSLDSDVEEFAYKVDDAIIKPLVEDRQDMHQLHHQSVRNLKERLARILTSKYRGAYLDLYGSCLSGLSLGNSSDVDISLFIPAASDLQKRYFDGKIDKFSFQKQMKKFVYKVYDSLAQRGNQRRHASAVEFGDLEAVPFARVPVIKGNYLYANNPFSLDGSMHFDICILNDIAVANSGLLRQYSLLDQRVRMLMLSVKSWIKWKNIGSAADGTLSSYTWMILCIYYLQCIGFLPSLQCPALMKAHGKEYDPRNRMHTVNGLRTVYLSSDLVLQHGIWEQPSHFKNTPVSGLLAGFFFFYARHFPQETTAVSIRLGNLSLQKTVFKSSRLWRLVVEDPFETHDSHCPHDLGTPMSDIGQVKVTKALREGADKMEKMYIDCSDIENCIGSFNFVEGLQVPNEDTENYESPRKEHYRKKTGGRGHYRNERNRAAKHGRQVNISRKKAPVPFHNKGKGRQVGRDNPKRSTDKGQGTSNRINGDPNATWKKGQRTRGDSEKKTNEGDDGGQDASYKRNRNTQHSRSQGTSNRINGDPNATWKKGQRSRGESEKKTNEGDDGGQEASYKRNKNTQHSRNRGSRNKQEKQKNDGSNGGHDHFKE